jgi:superfamily II DNA or RNA helicase
MLADTDELVAQAADKIYKSAGLIPDIEKAASHASLESDVVVGSIQSMARQARLGRFPADHFGLVIADEAHLSLSAGWQRVLKYWTRAKVLGITATPERGDGKKLLKFYEHLAAEIGLFDLINRGHLAPITVQVCPIEIDCQNLHADKKGEFQDEELEQAIEPYLEAIIGEWQKHAQDRKTLVFHPSRAASRKFAAMMTRAGIAAAHVDGESSDRKEILARFERGDFQVLNNAQLLTKGYDCPDIACVINLRPTKSRTQYLQMVGRGTRNAPGKTDLLVLDFLWQFQELGIMGPAALVASGEDAEQAVREVIERGNRMDLTEASRIAEREREQRVLDKLREAAKRGQRRRYDARTLGAMLHQPELLDYQPGERGQWELAKPSQAQLDLLARNAIDTRAVKSRGEASKIIDAIINRGRQDKATVKQVGLLLQLGHPDPSGLGFKEASRVIGEMLSGQRSSS